MSLLHWCMLLLMCTATTRVASAGNRERNLWTAILTNNLEDIEKFLDAGAKPNHRNEVSE
jgi:hypothetical protein